MNMEALVDFCQATTYEELSKKCQDWAFKIFGSYNSRMMFIENQQFIIIDHEKQLYPYPSPINFFRNKRFDCTMGLSGQAYSTHRPIIMSDVISAKEYNQLVDLTSNMPVYFGPVVLHPG